MNICMKQKENVWYLRALHVREHLKVTYEH